MKTMIWKELRENFKWALLAFLGLLLAEIYVLSSEEKHGGAGFTLCSSAFLMVTAFGCSVAGAALGLVQILPERRRDQWAALLHRPVSRSVIFFGKAIAGLLLYFAATALPMLASACYVAIPGKFAAPFIPGMMLPGLSDLTLGVVFYFGAVLACLGPGRWFGAKGMVVCSLAPVLMLHLGAGNAFLVLPLASAFILMLAAWGAMLGNGPLKGMPRAGRMSIVLVVLVGAQTVLAMLAVCLEFAAGKNGITVTYGNGIGEFGVTKDGKVLITRERADGSGSEVTDTEGNVITDERYVGNNVYGNICQFRPLRLPFEYVLDSLIRRSPRDLRNYVYGIRDPYHDAENWFVPVRGNYLVGYDKLSRRCVGSFGPQGFQPPGVKPEGFAAPLQISVFSSGDPMLIISGPKVYEFDFAERSMKVFFDAGNEAVRETVGFAYGPTNLRERVALALQNEVRIFDKDGKQLMAMPYPHDPKLWQFIEITASVALDRVYLMSERGYYGDSKVLEALPDFLDEYDARGNLLHTYSVPAPAVVPVPPSWADRLIAYGEPLGLVVFAQLYSRLDPDPTPGLVTTPQSEYLSDSAFSQWGALAVIALACAAGVFVLARRNGMSAWAALRWAVFVFVFGPAGVVAFRLGTDWPVRVRCPSCGHKRAIDGGECAACHHAWDIPQRNGTEILDGSAAEQA